MDRRRTRSSTKEEQNLPLTRLRARPTSSSTVEATKKVASSPKKAKPRPRPKTKNGETKKKAIKSEKAGPTLRPKALRGFPQRKELPEEVIGYNTVDGEVLYYVKWKNTMRAEFISSKEIKLRWPQLVIRYWEPIFTSQLKKIKSSK